MAVNLTAGVPEPKAARLLSSSTSLRRGDAGMGDGPGGRGLDDPLALAHALRQGLERGELTLRYQPILDLQEGRLHAVEVLLRWHSPELGEVSPVRFVPVAEMLGHIQPISEWADSRAAGELAPVLARCPHLRVTINLSPRQVTPGRLRRLIARLRGLDLRRVTLEVTESALLAASGEAVEAFAVARNAGIGLAIDDFGTGYASLGYLERHPVDLIKIDRRFAPGPGQDGRLAQAILAMAKALGLETVAEGIETEDQLAFYQQHGCRYVQGFLFAAPLTAAELDAFAGEPLATLGRRGGSAAAAREAPAPALAPTPPRPARGHLPEIYVERLEAFLTGASEWFWEMDEAYVVTFVSEGARAVGLDPGIAVGKTRWGMMGVDDPRGHELWAAHFADLEARRRFRGFVFSPVKPDGHVGRVEINGDPVFAPDGSFKGYRGTARDVTSKIETARRLAESEARLADFLESASDFFWETDCRHRLTWLSPSAARLNLKSDGMLGRTPWEVHGVTDPASHPEWREHMAELAAWAPFRRTFTCNHGTELSAGCSQTPFIEISGRPFFDQAGRFLGYRGSARDVTAARQAEATRRQQTEQLELAGEIAKLGYWRADYRAQRLVWSAQMFKIVARDPQSFAPDLGNRFVIYHPEDRPRVQATVDLASAEKRDFELRARVVRPNGEVRHVMSKGRCSLDANGEVDGFFGIFQDVTETVEAEQALAAKSRENELFRVMLESIPDPVWMKERDGRIFFVNKAAARLVGRRTPEEVVGRRNEELGPPEITRVKKREDDSVYESGEARLFEHRFIDPDGRTIWYSTLKAPLRGEGGAITGLIGHSRDITELRCAKEGAEEQSRANALYRAMIEALPDYLFAKDLAGRFIAANGATARLMGVSSGEELRGRTDFDFYEAELATRFEADERDLYRSGRSAIFEQPCRREDGSPGWLCSLKSPLRDEAGRIIGYVGHGRDVTEEREVRAQAARLSQELEQAHGLIEEAMAIFAGGFALFDRADRLTLCNDAFARAYGARPAALVGLTFEELQNRPQFRALLGLDDAQFASWLEARMAAHRRADSAPLETRHGDEWFVVRERRLADGSLVLARMSITHLKETEAELRRLATIDPLTEIANRRHFVDQSGRLLDRARGNGQAVALALLDIDHFKRINDRFGHATGDRVLREFSRQCTTLLRPGDLFARWGGEEFILLLPATDQAAALAVAERLRLAASVIDLPDAATTVTLSVGVVASSGGESVDELARRADQALYRAKSEGRNRVELARDDD